MTSSDISILNTMEGLCSRQTFCDLFSRALLETISREACKEVKFNRCILQCIGTGVKRKRTELVITKSILCHLSKLFYPESDCPDSAFVTIVENSLRIIKEESKKWSVPILMWKQVKEGYVIEVDRSNAFKGVLQSILQTHANVPHNDTTEDGLIFCHLDSKPSLDDLRCLVSCSIIQRCLLPSWQVAFSTADPERLCEQSARLLDLGLNHYLPGTQVDEDDTANISSAAQKLSQIPESFCHSLTGKNPPFVKRFQRTNSYDTALGSHVQSPKKNIFCSAMRDKFRQKYSPEAPCIHICTHKNKMQAQQTELYHAWLGNTDSPELMSSVQTRDQNSITLERYFVHAGVHGRLTASSFLDLRSQQIKESFEAKHQVTATGERWSQTINEMRAAVIKLELLGVASSTKLKLSEDSLPVDSTFVLYNFSRLSTLLKTFDDKVEKGEYPPQPPIAEVDFSLLVEEKEWEMFLNHLWIFGDVIKTPVVAIQDSAVRMSTHHLVSYLGRLCRCLSAFYSRHHILVENLPHLMPLIHARIYLVKATVCVMKYIFQLLGVRPLQEM